MHLWTKTFWIATAERAIKTFAQAAVAILTAGATGLLEVDWAGVASASALAALVSVLTSVASNNVGPTPGPSLAGEYTIPDEIG